MLNTFNVIIICWNLLKLYYDKLMEKDKIVQSGQSPTVAIMYKLFKHNSKKTQLSKPFQCDLFENSNNKINKL